MSLTSSPKINVPGTLVDARSFTLAFTSAGRSLASSSPTAIFPSKSSSSSSNGQMYNLPNHHLNAEHNTHTQYTPPYSPLIASYRVFGGFYFPSSPAAGVSKTTSSPVVSLHSPISNASFFIPSTPLLDTRSLSFLDEDEDWFECAGEEEEGARPTLQRNFAQQDLSTVFAASSSSSSSSSTSSSDGLTATTSSSYNDDDDEPPTLKTSRSNYHTADMGVSYDPEADSEEEEQVEEDVFEEEDVNGLEDVDKAVLRAAMLFAHQLITSLPSNSPLSTKIHVVRTFLQGYLPTADANAVLSYLPLEAKPEPLPKKHHQRIVKVFTTIVEESDEELTDEESEEESDDEEWMGMCPPGCEIEGIKEEEPIFQSMCLHEECECRVVGRPVVQVEGKKEKRKRKEGSKPRPKMMKPSSRTRALSRHSLFYLNSPQL